MSLRPAVGERPSYGTPSWAEGCGGDAARCRSVRGGSRVPEQRGGRMVVDLLCGVERTLSEVMRGYEENTWMFIGC